MGHGDGALSQERNLQPDDMRQQREERRVVISAIVCSGKDAGEGVLPWVSAVGSGVLSLVARVMKRV